MTRWIRLGIASSCGNCSKPLPVDATVLEFARRPWAVIRCVACAGEEPPDSVDPPVRTSTKLRIDFNDRIDAMRGGRDWKHAQAGER